MADTCCQKELAALRKKIEDAPVVGWMVRREILVCGEWKEQVHGYKLDCKDMAEDAVAAWRASPALYRNIVGPTPLIERPEL